MSEVVGSIIRQARPLFVALDLERHRKQRRRGQTFAKAVDDACTANGVMLIHIKSRDTRALSDHDRPTNWHIAKALAEMIPHLDRHLPSRRRLWASEDERMGLFTSLAAAVCAWEQFRKKQ
jgi:hypothetical protein